MHIDEQGSVELEMKDAAYTPGDFDIAIVGMAGRFPGAHDVEAFWRGLADGIEMLSDFSDEEVLAAGIAPALAADPHYVKRGGVLEDAELFDARFFGVYPREAEIMDPQQRVFLELAWTALEHAGYDPATYGGAIAVFAGSGMNTYLLFNLLGNREVRETVQGYQLNISNDKDFLPTRVAYKLNLRGPAINVQTACSTSLVATHLACQALLNFQCDMALAGGATVRVPQKGGYLYQEGGIASPDGRCRAFAADAAGTVGGNGAGIIVLKRLTDALAEGDTIYAVIKGSAINNDGSAKVGYTAPSIEGQTAVIANAQGIAGVAPDTISYIEAHGTGTALGDPIEIAALTQVFRERSEGTLAPQYCAIGSLKTSVGHLDAAAGVASVIKTALALTHRQIPPSLHFDRPNPHIDFTNSPFYVNTTLRDWISPTGPRRAGVSSFGIGGTNAHAIMEEAPAQGATGPSRPWQLLLLSAKTEPALARRTADLADYLARNTPTAAGLADVAYTLHVGRQALAQRSAAVVRDAADALAVLSGREPGRLLLGDGAPSSNSVAFMFTGQGSQYPGMGAGLYETEPVFREYVDRCAELLRPHLGLDIRDLLYPPAGQAEAAAERLRQTALTQPALFVIEYALAQLWLSWGIRPDALIGHSIGEYVALVLSDVMSLADALRIVAARGRLMAALPGGSMLSLPLSQAEAQRLLAGRPNLTVATINAPALVVVAGPHEAVDALERELAAQGIAGRRLHTSHAFHSAMMDPILAPFAEVVRQVRLSPPQIPVISNVTGTWLTPKEATDPAYYARHLRSAVRFADGVATLAAEPDRVLLEVGPGRTLASLAKAHPAVGRDRAVLTSLRGPQDGQDDLAGVLAALGQLWLAGIAADWAAFHAHEVRRRIPLPTYPFERQRYWIEPSRGAEAAQPAAAIKRSDIGRWFYVPSWRRTARPAAADEAGEWLLFTDAGPAAADLAGRLTARGAGVQIVRPGTHFARGEGGYTVRPGDAADYELLIADLATNGRLPSGIVHLWTAEPDAGPDDAIARGFDSVIALARGWGKHGGPADLRLAVITTAAAEVTGAEPLWPVRATVLGACRVIPQEYPHIACQVIDVTDLGAEAAEVAAELAAPSAEPVVAYRNRHRWAQAFEPAATSAQDGLGRLRQGGVYLITGGLGRIGGVLAEHLARTVCARLALVDRSALPPRETWDGLLAEDEAPDWDVDGGRAGAGPAPAPNLDKIRQILALEALGAETLTMQADVADPAQMAAVVARTTARFGALHGVIHAAGAVGEAAVKAVAETGPAERDAQFRAKVVGTQALAEALAGRPVDFVVLMSSISTVLGGLGFAAYAAANSFLDAFAAQQARAAEDQQRWISAAWDGWGFAEPGALGRAAAKATDFAITPAEGGQAFTRLLGLDGAAQAVIATADLEARLAQWARPKAAEPEAEGSPTAPATTRHTRPNLRTAFIAPVDEIESAIAADWEQILGIAPIGIHDDFFELGGHSLLATQLVSRLRDAYRVELPLRNLFETPTIAGLAELIRNARPQASDAGAATALAASPAAIRPRPRLTAEDGTSRLPLSFGQQRLWFLDQLDPGSPLYNNFAALRIDGPIDAVLLARCVNTVIARHEVLRTVYGQQEGRPTQRILDALEIAVPVTDLQDLAPDARQQEVTRLALAEARAPFDLATGPLLRAHLLRTGPQEHVLFFTMHHIVSDGWSVGVLMHELIASYQAFSAGADASVLPPLPVQYADYAAWQRDWLAGAGDAGGSPLAEQMAYWRARLGDDPLPLELPTDRPRPATQTTRGANQWFTLPPELHRTLDALARQEGATLFMTLLAGLQALLHRYAGQEDISVGTPVANRIRGETEPLIGFLLNTLVLRCDLSDAPSFRQLLARVKETALGAYAHQDVPFEMLVEALQPTRDMSRSPFFQVMFDLQAEPLAGLALPGATLTPLPVDGGTAKFDLALSMTYGDTLGGYLNYNTDLFDAETARAMVTHFQALLSAASAEPDRPIAMLPMLSEAETRQILRKWSAGALTARATRSVVAMFEAQAAARPHATALALAAGVTPDPQATMSYADLDARANQLARHLVTLGAGPETIVALVLERSLDMAVAILGTLKAGSAFLPIDPDNPADRIAFILKDSGAQIVVTQTRVLEAGSWKLEADGEGQPGTLVRLEADWPEIARHPASKMPDPRSQIPDSLAYVVYTSGSTGQPKGVLIEQDGLAQHLTDVAALFELRPEDRVLQFAAYTFDQGLEQILATLTAGATLVVRGPEIWPPADFPQVMANYGLSVINLPPAYWGQVLQAWRRSAAAAAPDQLRLIISGGDVLSADSLRWWQETPARDARLLNAYGPTETTVTATTFDVPGDWFTATDQPVPIGRPLPNRLAYIVDPHGNLAPAGVPGELLLGGAGLARGYLNRPELTAEQFAPNPFADETRGHGDKETGRGDLPILPSPHLPLRARLYRTGDLVRWRRDGAIEFMGRIDQQVKIRGFRIELGEIERALATHPAVREAAVTAREDTPGDKRLVGYIVSQPNTSITAADLRGHLAERLPGYMTPSAFVMLERLPVTASGKVDRRNLPAPAVGQSDAATYVPPRTPTEEEVAGIWAQVLGLPRVGINDNFFDLGGHSLLATQILARLHESFPVELPLRQLFEKPTVASLAALIEESLLAQQSDDTLLALLQELEGLSDEEARRLLEERQD